MATAPEAASATVHARTRPGRRPPGAARLLAALIVAAGALAVPTASGAAPGGAPGEDVSGPRFTDLAGRAAAGDAGALEALGEVTSVDGVAVRIGPLLEGDPADVRGRLRALAGAPPGAPSASPEAPSAELRARSEAVLRAEKYRPARTIAPLRGLLEWLGDRLAPLGRPFAWAARRLDGRGVWLAGVALAAVAAWLAASVAGRRRLRAAAPASVAWGLAEAGADPAALERRAEAAEAAGQHELALRLRFAAGLLRLDARGRITLRDTLTTGELRGVIAAERFDRLADVHDEVVYGLRPATEDDSAEARRDWADLLGAGRR